MAVDTNPNNAHVYYKIFDGPWVTNNESSHFSIGRETGQIYTRSRTYDYETRQTYTATVQVTSNDYPNTIDTVPVHIRLTDRPEDETGAMNPPSNLILTRQGTDMVQLAWDAGAAYSGVRITKHQFRIAREPATAYGRRWNGAAKHPDNRTFRDDGWMDIPVTGSGRLTHTIGGTVEGHALRRLWELKVQVRSFANTSKGSPPSNTARLPDVRPEVEEVRITSDPGTDGTYARDDRITAELVMSEAVEVTGGTPSFHFVIGQNVRTMEYTGMEESAWDPGGTVLQFGYTVQAGDDDNNGIEIPIGAIRKNGANINEATHGGTKWVAGVNWNKSWSFSAHKVDTTQARVVSTLWYGDRAWVTFNNNLRDSTRGLVGFEAFQMHYSEGCRPYGKGVTGLSISGNTVQLQLGRIVKVTDSAFTFQSDPNGCGSVYITHRGVSANEALALRDTSGNRAEKFSRRFASNRRKGAVLSIEDAQASETDDDSLDFTVVLNPAATGTVTVDYATADGTATQPSDYTATSGTLTFTAGQTTKTIEVPIVDDDMEDDGETLTVTLSNPSGAVIEDGNATGTISNTEEETTNALTAAFQNVPSEHDGEDHAFDIRILFDAALSGSWTSVRDAIRVTNGTHTKTHRVDGRSDLWNIGVEATSDADVTVTLAASVACGERGALCTSDSRRFETAISTVIDGPDEDEEEGDTTVTPLTATLQGMPSTHNGSTAFQFRIRFSEELTSYSYKTLRDHSVRVTQGDTTTGASSVRRMVQGKNDYWEVTVTPRGAGDISIALGPTTDCSATGAMCTGHRRQPSSALERSDSNRRRTTPAEHRGRNRRRSRQCNGRLRGDPVEGSFRHRDRGVRNIGRKCTRWIGLHRGVGDADVRRRRADEDDQRHRARRLARRGQRDVQRHPVRRNWRRLARRRHSHRDHHQHRSDAEGVAHTFWQDDSKPSRRCHQRAHGRRHRLARHGRRDAARCERQRRGA